MSINSSRPIVAPYYAAAAVWLLYALCFPLYRPAHFICAAAASIAVFILAMGLCRSGAKRAGANADRAAQAAEASTSKPASTGNAELDKTLKDGALALEEMRRLDRNIEDEKISADIVRLQQTSEKIFDYVKEHPDKLSDIRKFMNYYLPTTLKILNAYDRMDAAGISGENIDATKKKVEQMMATISQAFDRQLDALFGDEALDISTDITVMEQMLQREGLGGQKKDGDGGVTLEL